MAEIPGDDGVRGVRDVDDVYSPRKSLDVVPRPVEDPVGSEGHGVDVRSREMLRRRQGRGVRDVDDAQDRLEHQGVEQVGAQQQKADDPEDRDVWS